MPMALLPGMVVRRWR